MDPRTAACFGIVALLAGCTADEGLRDAGASDGGIDAGRSADSGPVDAHFGIDVTDDAGCPSPASLRIRPELVSMLGRFTCDEAHVAELRVWLFAGDALVVDAVVPCSEGVVVLEDLDPGPYDLAAWAESDPGDSVYVRGVGRLEPWFPGHDECSGGAPPPVCAGVPVVVCGETTLDLPLSCQDSFSSTSDSCGGA